MNNKTLSVVVVEDDPQQRGLLVGELNAQGFRVTGCADAMALWRHLSVAGCDVIVLDVGLPGENGLSIASHLRAASNVGIVMLTGYDTNADQARGLRSGADAYLTKPVDYEILAVTVQNIGRRVRAVPPSVGTVLSEGVWKLVANGWKLCTPDHHEVMLTAYERSLLRCLTATEGRPADRETLIGAMTDDVHNFDLHRLEMVIYRLRRKVSAVSEWTLPLQAVRGVGYLINDMEDESANMDSLSGSASPL